MFHIFSNLITNPDVSIIYLFEHYQDMIYIIMFGEFFIETAFIPASFLPWDGLMFLMWALSHHVVNPEAPGAIDLDAIYYTLLWAGFIGDIINYYLGKRLWNSLVGKSWHIFWRSLTLIPQSSVSKTQAFLTEKWHIYLSYGRILPIFRNFVPFVAGLVDIPRKTFLIYNTIGMVITISAALGLWLLFGDIPWVSQHVWLMMRLFVGLIVIWPFVLKRLVAQFTKQHTSTLSV